MKNRWRAIWGAILLPSTVAAYLVGCTSSTVSGTVNGTEITVKNDREVRVGIALYDTSDAFIASLAEAIQKTLEKEGEKKEVSVQIVLADGENNKQLQEQQLQQFLLDGCDVVAVNIVEDSTTGAMVEQAKNANIPIIFFHKEPIQEVLATWEGAYYVGQEGPLVGQLQGEMLVDAIEGGLKIDKNRDGVIQYVMLEGTPGEQDTVWRSHYSEQVLLEKNLVIEKLASDTAMWNRSEAKELMTEWITHYGSTIEVVFANNDEMALGAVEALKASGYLKEGIVPVIGVDGSTEAMTEIEQGWMLGTVYKDADLYGEKMTELIFHLIEENPTQASPSKYIAVPQRIVTKGSVHVGN